MNTLLYEALTKRGYATLNDLDCFNNQHLQQIWQTASEPFFNFIQEQGDDLKNICAYTALRDRAVNVPHSIWGADKRTTQLWNLSFGQVGLTTFLGPDYERELHGYPSRFYWLAPHKSLVDNFIEKTTFEYCLKKLEEPLLVDYIGFGYAAGNCYVGTHIDAGVNDGLLKFDVNLNQENCSAMLCLDNSTNFKVLTGEGYFLSPTMKHSVPPNPNGWRVNFHCNIILLDRVHPNYLNRS